MTGTGKYETMFVFSLASGEETTQALVSKFQDLIGANGTLDSAEEWGKRKLAYPINDETEGFYVLVNFTAGPEFPNELERVFNITDGALRILTLKKA